MQNRIDDGLKWLSKYVILEEALLVGVELVSSGEVRLTFEVGLRNLTEDACKDWGVPEDEASAREVVAKLLGPTGKIVVQALNAVAFRFDRLSRHGRPDLLFDKASSAEVERVSWTVFGFSVERSSEMLDSLGPYRDRCTHLVLDLVDGRLDLVSEKFAVELRS